MTIRSYGQYCGIARALDLVGERWALLVVRELILGPKRFTDLRHGLPGVATNVLSQRLKQLEREGVVRRRTLPPPAASAVYELTEHGRELEPIMLALGRWGAQTMGPREPEQSMQSGWLMVALKAYFRPAAANGLHATVALRLDDETFAVRVDDGALEIAAGEPDLPDLTIAGGPEALLGYLAGAPGARAGLAAEGDLGLLERLPEIFAFAVGGASAA